MLAAISFICIAYILPLSLGGMKFYLSAETSNWRDIEKHCKPANVSLICSDIMCNIKRFAELGDSKLPASFGAWINAYLIKSASIVYKGCFQVSKNVTDMVSLRGPGYTDIIKCTRICLSSYLVPYSYLGIHKNTCYCMSDIVFGHPEATEKSASENTCLDVQDNLQSYEILKHDYIDKDRCPVAYPIKHVVIYLEDCYNNNNKLFCVGIKSTDVESNSWYKAQEYCKNHSTTLVNRFHLPDFSMKYWTHGLQYNEYEFRKPFPLFDTRCAALMRDNSKFYVDAINCSSILPTLCQIDQRLEPPHIETTRQSPILDKTTFPANEGDFKIGIVDKNMDTKTTMTVTIVTKPTTTMITTSTKIILENTTNSTPETNIDVVYIVIPIVVAVLIAVGGIIFFILYKRRASRRSDEPQTPDEGQALKHFSEPTER